MGYIKFRLERYSDSEGRTIHTVMKRVESDMDSLKTLQPNFLMHAMANYRVIQMFLRMDEGVLDRDMLMGAEPMMVDTGVLDCDTLI